MTRLLELLEGTTTERTVDEGETIIREDHPVQNMFILKSGEVEIVKGNTRICRIVSEGSTFGEMAVLLDSPATASVRALKESTFVVVDDPISFLSHNTEATLEVARILARRVEWVTRNFADERGKPSEEEIQAAMRDSFAKRVFGLRG